jgi:preprotein translocase subunit YajC
LKDGLASGPGEDTRAPGAFRPSIAKALEGPYTGSRCLPAASGRRFLRAPGLFAGAAAPKRRFIVLGALHPLAASSSSGGSGISLIVFLVLIVGSFYFLLIRPQQRRARQQRSLVDSIDVGDEVMTIGGMYATVRGMDDESFTLEVAPGVDVRVTKSAVARKLVYEDVDEDDQQGEAEEADDQA